MKIFNRHRHPLMTFRTLFLMALAARPQSDRGSYNKSAGRTRIRKKREQRAPQKERCRSLKIGNRIWIKFGTMQKDAVWLLINDIKWDFYKRIQNSRKTPDYRQQTSRVFRLQTREMVKKYCKRVEKMTKSRICCGFKQNPRSFSKTLLLATCFNRFNPNLELQAMTIILPLSGNYFDADLLESKGHAQNRFFAGCRIQPETISTIFHSSLNVNVTFQ